MFNRGTENTISEVSKFISKTHIFNRKAKEFHPDVNPSAEAHSMFQEVSEAYKQIIKDKEKFERENTR